MGRNERLEAELFGTGHGPSGINFDRYEDIPVEATGNNVPSGIEDVRDLSYYEVIEIFSFSLTACARENFKLTS